MIATATILALHNNISFCVAHPLQLGIAAAFEDINSDDSTFLSQLESEYQERFDILNTSLEAFFDGKCKILKPEGAFYITVDISSTEIPAQQFAFNLIQCARVSCIPLESFFSEGNTNSSNFIRFAFCKTLDTLKLAQERLSQSSVDQVINFNE